MFLLVSVGRRISGALSMTSRSFAFSSQPTGLDNGKTVKLDGLCVQGQEKVNLLDIDEMFNLLHVGRLGPVLLVWEEVVHLIVHDF